MSIKLRIGLRHLENMYEALTTGSDAEVFEIRQHLLGYAKMMDSWEPEVFQDFLTEKSEGGGW